MLPPIIVALLCLGAATYAFLLFLLRWTHDPAEPPMLETAIPFISPLLAMRKEKSKLHLRLRLVQ